MSFLLLAVAAFLAGGLNAVAGGGTFLTLPALIFTGMPPIQANATSAVAVLPGYIGSAVSFRKDLSPVAGIGIPGLLVVGLLGGLAGALLLLVTPAEVFRSIVPWLLLIATALFAFGPKLALWLRGRAANSRLTVVVSLFVVSIYGGYFNGGLGILLLALFSLLGMVNLNSMNGLKNVLSAVLALIAAVTFAAAGIVEWPEAAIMMVAATLGGYAGASVARRLPPALLRGGIVVVGLVMAVLFFMG
ncbi:sulfite exporter TauE/SafE family protein [Telmatospirillum sp. J64-1]|uniref:sulfite exporter TauE/SafE family protein n=1 Tax=Telmatospirillum sp. J64-1 TaxID=2502183 RepID=UPI00115DC700|nr:sulfite exporter TauE/SafE family protein [Telmatospirillum sp. J64-1]